LHFPNGTFVVSRSRLTTERVARDDESAAFSWIPHLESVIIGPDAPEVPVMTRCNTLQPRYVLVVLAAWMIGGKSSAPADDPKKSVVVLEVRGTIVPVRHVAVSPIAAGQVTLLLIEEGQKVKQGEVLARLDDTLARIDVRRAEARLAAARARLALLKAGPPKEEEAAAQSAVAQAEETLKYRQSVLKRYQDAAVKGVVKVSVLDEEAQNVKAARAQVETAKYRLQALRKGPRPEEVAVGEAKVKQAEAELQLAQHRLDQTTIRAPFEGTVLTRKAEVGSFVNPLAFSAGAQICQIADLRQMEVVVDVTERDLARIQRGKPCLIRADAHPNVAYKGVVARLSPVANRDKGTVAVRIRIEIPEKDESLLPNMSAIVTFLEKE
jgi:HlyD family secretion protein